MHVRENDKEDKRFKCQCVDSGETLQCTMNGIADMLDHAACTLGGLPHA